MKFCIVDEWVFDSVSRMSFVFIKKRKKKRNMPKFRLH